MERSSTAGETSTAPLPRYDKARLTGKLVRIWPYVRGQYPRDILYTCWSAMEREGMSQKVFHSSYWPSESPFDWRGDLTEFVTYFSQTNRLLQICQAIENEDLAGLIWFEDIVPQKRASCGIWFKRQYWGPLTLEASQICKDYAFYGLDIPKLYSFTPWPEAKRHAQKIGFEYVTSIPELVQAEEEAYPMNVLVAKRGEDNGRR